MRVMALPNGWKSIVEQLMGQQCFAVSILVSAEM
jgi:hypothetical protein